MLRVLLKYSKMAEIRNSRLSSDVYHALGSKRSIPVHDIKFVMDRYFHYATQAMFRGHRLTGCYELGFVMASILFGDIPDKFRKMFTYSFKIFGFTFLPICDHHEIKKHGYNFKPGKKILSDIAVFTETDDIYILTQRK